MSKGKIIIVVSSEITPTDLAQLLPVEYATQLRDALIKRLPLDSNEEER